MSIVSTQIVILGNGNGHHSEALSELTSNCSKKSSTRSHQNKVQHYPYHNPNSWPHHSK